MHVDTVSAYKLRTAQQYAEAAGSLVEELDKLMLRRPMPITNQSNPGARAAYAQTLGNWYLENAGLFTAVLIASRLLNDRAAADLDDLNEAADAQSGPTGGPNAAGQASSLPEPQSRENAVLSQMSADMAACLKVYQEMEQGKQPAQQSGTKAPGGVLFYRQALVDRQNQQPKPTRKQKGRAATSAEE